MADGFGFPLGFTKLCLVYYRNCTLGNATLAMSCQCKRTDTHEDDDAE